MANWNFRRSVSVGGLRLNFSKSGVGYSVGGPWYRVGRTATGRSYTTTRIPGTGMYKREYGSSSSKGTSASNSQLPPPATKKPNGPLAGAFIAGILGIGFLVGGLWLIGVILLLIAGGFIVQVVLTVSKAVNTSNDAKRKEAASDALEKGEPETALSHVEPLLGHTDDPEVPVLAGLAYERSDRGEEAEAAFEAAHKKAGNMATLCLYADQVRHNGKPKDAVKMLQAEAPADPKHAALYFAVMGQCFLDMGDPAAALDVAERGPVEAKETDHDHLCLMYVHGSALEGLGRWKEALADFERVRAVAIDFEDVEERIEKIKGKVEK